jgi:prepilin-type N-terminal cleavage/methylation domain-containing protein
MTRSRIASLKAPPGFTLIEVMVSAAILAIVLAVMFSALSTSMSLWRNTDNKIVADREARAIELLLARDLANVVMPPATNFWPRIITNRVGRENVYYLKFLTATPADAQPATGGNTGDICYVEYAVLPSTTNGPGREVRRLFWPSRKTYTDVLSRGTLPGPQTADQFESLGLNLLPTNTWAARGLGELVNEANNTHFVLLDSDLLPFTPGPNNYPAAIEVNFAVADPTTLANTNLISRSTYVLRNAGLYSFRIPLPRPPSAP